MKKVLVVFSVMLLTFALTSCSCDHVFSEFLVQTPATCTSPGVEARACIKCDETEKREIPAIAHDYGEWETITDATCVALGEKTSVCSACGETQREEIALVDHTYGEWKTAKEATCVALGEKTSTCSVCGDVQSEEIALGDHTYGAWKTTTPATCTSNGTKMHSCNVCGAEEKDNIPATGHNYKKSVLTKTSCTQDGRTKYTCQNCSNTYEETTPATGHKWKAATCTSAKTCSSCGLTDGNALGHNAGSNGNCTRCGQKVTIDMKTKLSAPTEEFAVLRGKNSVGLVKLVWTADNNSGKTIKYYTTTVYYYNSVGDPARNDITGKTSYTVKYVGPVEPGETVLVSEVGYCSICREVVVGEVTLEYTDGTTDTGWYGYRFKIP